MKSNQFDLIVVGSGFSGLTAAATAVRQGRRVGLVSAGSGMFVFGAGCIENQKLPEEEHPELLGDAISLFHDFTREADIPFQGGLAEQHYLPTILGTFQAVEMAPFSVAATAVAANRVAVVGIDHVTSFNADFTTERLQANAKRLGLPATYVSRQISLSNRDDVVPTPLHIANRFDRDESFRHELLETLLSIARDVDLIVLPGILGQRSGFSILSRFEQALHCHIGEMPTLPPSIPGLRLSNALEDHLRMRGVEFFKGYPVTSLMIEGNRCQGITIDTPAHTHSLSAKAIILASGKFSGSLLGNSSFEIDDQLRPVGTNGGPIAENLHVIGTLLPVKGPRGGNERAILTGYRAGMLAGEGHYAVQ